MLLYPALIHTIKKVTVTVAHISQITDPLGQLQYVPFPTCNETNRPLELFYGIESGIALEFTSYSLGVPPELLYSFSSVANRISPAEINCTLAAIDDPLFHLLEFYVHNDAPLTCRIPTRPNPYSSPSAKSTSNKDQKQAPISLEPGPDDYIPLVFALSGKLQLSHLHVSPNLNVVFHTSFPRNKKEKEQRKENRRKGLIEEDEGAILAATAYSTPSLTSSSIRIIIGDPLALRLNVHWYASPDLPPSTTPTSYLLGEHVHFSTLAYCLLSAGGGAMGALAYFRGVELPKRIRRYGKERMGGERGYAFPGNGWGGGGGIGGKRD